MHLVAHEVCELRHVRGKCCTPCCARCGGLSRMACEAPGSLLLRSTRSVWTCMDTTAAVPTVHDTTNERNYEFTVCTRGTVAEQRAHCSELTFSQFTVNAP